MTAVGPGPEQRASANRKVYTCHLSWSAKGNVDIAPSMFFNMMVSIDHCWCFIEGAGWLTTIPSPSATHFVMAPLRETIPDYESLDTIVFDMSLTI